MPELKVLPHDREAVIVVGTSVRKTAAILGPHLETVDAQVLPPGVRVHYVFVSDYPDDDPAETVLRAFVAQRGGEVIQASISGVGDFADDHPITHQWTESSITRVGQNKNRILRRALDLNADAVFLVDSDLILDERTLWSLLHTEKDLVSAVYWTRWQRTPSEDVRVHAGPQVWLRHPYDLHGRGMDEAEFRSKLIRRELTRVWGLGACTLIRRRVLEAGVNFDPMPELHHLGGMAIGEDRAFCTRAERLHLEMWADPWPEIFHVYHLPDDIALIPEYRARWSHVRKPEPDGLVSLCLEAVEPVPTGPGQWNRVQPVRLRGRVASLGLMPEIEEAVLQMDVGQTILVPVHFPIHYPVPFLRGRRRIIRLTLVDAKPYGFPPVVEDELYVGQWSGRWADMTTLTPRQHEGIREVANG